MCFTCSIIRFAQVWPEYSQVWLNYLQVRWHNSEESWISFFPIAVWIYWVWGIDIVLGCFLNQSIIINNEPIMSDKDMSLVKKNSNLYSVCNIKLQPADGSITKQILQQPWVQRVTKNETKFMKLLEKDLQQKLVYSSTTCIYTAL